MKVPNQLSYKNSWESYSYFVGNKEITSLKEVIIGDKVYPVHSNLVSVSYSDHGHTYDGTSRHYFITVIIGKTEVEIDLNKLLHKKEKIIATKFILGKT